MAEPKKRTTVYLDPLLHKALRLKSIETSSSMSDLINDAIREDLAEDADDLSAVAARKKEPTVTFEGLRERPEARWENIGSLFTNRFRRTSTG